MLSATEELYAKLDSELHAKLISELHAKLDSELHAKLGRELHAKFRFGGSFPDGSRPRGCKQFTRYRLGWQ